MICGLHVDSACALLHQSMLHQQRGTSSRSSSGGHRHRQQYSPTVHGCSMSRRNDVSRTSLRTGAVPVQKDPAVEAQAIKRFDRQAKMEVLREDLTHLFDDQGIDPNEYEEVVEFVDPITKYSSIKGYLGNISMLKKVFSPKFILHDMRPEGESGILTRWTMVMTLTAVTSVPVVGKLWRPRIVFSGTSLYVYRPSSGRIMRHIDTWDSISNQKFFSLEAFADFLGQVAVLQSVPELETPQYTILKRFKDYEVRKYEPFLVAEYPMDLAAPTAASASDSGSSNGISPSSNSSADSKGNGATHSGSSSSSGSSMRPLSPAGPGNKAFNALAGYIFGKNKEGQRMSMTTPVFSSSSGTMQFVVGPSAVTDVSKLPAPLTPGVVPREEPGGTFAVRSFSGLATEELSQKEQVKLRTSLMRDGHQLASSTWSLARYNDPSTWAVFRRNEVLLPLKDFQLW